MNGQSGRHFLDEGEVESRRPVRAGIARALLVGGRVLPVITIAAVGFSRLTHASWARAGLDGQGFTTAWQPNLAFALSFVMGFAIPFVVLPVASSSLVTREADMLTVSTVLGRRRIDLASATAWRAWLPGQGGDTQVVLLRSRTGWAAVLASESWVPRTQALLVDALDRPGVRPGWSLYLRGWLLMLLWVAAVIVCVVIGGSIAGFV